MTIGFFDYDVEILSVFKDAVKMFPEFEYVAYIETRESPSHDSLLPTAMEWFETKNVQMIVVGESASPEFNDIQSTTKKSVTVIKSTEVIRFLKSLNMNENKDKGTVRIIHLTQHSDALDASIAEILGGVFIAQ